MIPGEPISLNNPIRTLSEVMIIPSFLRRNLKCFSLMALASVGIGSHGGRGEEPVVTFDPDSSFAFWKTSFEFGDLDGVICSFELKSIC